MLLVSASRRSQAAFERSTWLAAALRRAATACPLRLFAQNKRGLPDCYNEAIEAAEADEVLVFVHDDVHLDDWMLGLRLQEAWAQFDVVGMAGTPVASRAS